MFLKVAILALSATLCVAINGPNIVRPCGIKNLPCIRASLGSGARCLKPRSPAPATYTVPKARFDAPAFNASYEDINLIIRGLDRCYVSEYYINRVNNGRLLAIDCPWLTFESTRIMYQHYLRQEDGIFRYSINGSYPLLTINTPMPAKPDFCNANSNIYVHALPIFNISPFDRPTQNHLTVDLSALTTFEQETFAARAPLLSRLVFNGLLCDSRCY